MPVLISHYVINENFICNDGQPFLKSERRMIRVCFVDLERVCILESNPHVALMGSISMERHPKRNLFNPWNCTEQLLPMLCDDIQLCF